MTEARNVCKNNCEVRCLPHEHHCERCGWNPEVAQRRLQNFLNNYGKKSEPSAPVAN